MSTENTDYFRFLEQDQQDFFKQKKLEDLKDDIEEKGNDENLGDIDSLRFVNNELDKLSDNDAGV